MAEIEYKGLSISGTKWLIIFPLIGTILGSLYGGFDTIKSNFLSNIFSKDLLNNLILLSNLCLVTFFLAIKIAFLELSTPVPKDCFKVLNKLTIMQPDPVPISKLDIIN